MTDLTQKFDDALAAARAKPDLYSRVEALEGIGKKLEAEMGKVVTEEFLDHEARESVAALGAGVVVATLVAAFSLVAGPVAGPTDVLAATSFGMWVGLAAAVCAKALLAAEAVPAFNKAVRGGGDNVLVCKTSYGEMDEVQIFTAMESAKDAALEEIRVHCASIEHAAAREAQLTALKGRFPELFTAQGPVTKVAALQPA